MEPTSPSSRPTCRFPRTTAPPTTSPGLEIPAGLSLPSTQGGEVDLGAAAAAPGHARRLRLPADRRPRRALARRLGRHPRRPRLHAAELRLPRQPRRVRRRSAPRWSGSAPRAAAEQAEFAEREHIPFPLLADPGLRLAAALRLPTFEVEGMTLYRRLTLSPSRAASSRPSTPSSRPTATPPRCSPGCGPAGAAAPGRGRLMEAAGIEPASAVAVRGCLQV